MWKNVNLLCISVKNQTGSVFYFNVSHLTRTDILLSHNLFCCLRLSVLEQTRGDGTHDQKSESYMWIILPRGKAWGFMLLLLMQWHSNDFYRFTVCQYITVLFHWNNSSFWSWPPSRELGDSMALLRGRLSVPRCIRRAPQIELNGKMTKEMKRL